MSNQITSFAKQIIAILKGDDAAVTAQKIYRVADSTLKSSIALKQADLVSKEQSVEDAQEHLANMRINKGIIIGDARENYLRNLINAKKDLDLKEENLENLKKEIEFLQSELAIVNS